MAYLSSYKSFGLCYLLLLRLIFTDDHSITFLHPTTGLTLNYQDSVNVSYLSSFPEPMLFTFCYNSTNNGLIQETQQNVQPYNGSQLVELVWQGVSSCNFDLRLNSSAGYGASSPMFIVLPNARVEATTVGPSTTVSTGTTTSTSSSGSNSSNKAAATSTVVPNTINNGTAVHIPSWNSGLSSRAKAGIGVRVAIVAIAAIAGTVFFFLRRRKFKKYPPNPTMPGNHEEFKGYGQKYQPVGSEPGSYVHMQEIGGVKVKPIELSSEVAHELPGGEVRHEMGPETTPGNTRRNN